MHHPHPAQSPIIRIPVLPVLQDRVLHPLTRQRILQLRRSHRNTVHEQTQIDGPVTRRLVTKLAGHRQHIRPVQLHQLQSQPTRRPKKRQPDPHVPIHHPPPQHIHRPPLIELRRQPLHETRSSLAQAAAVASTNQKTPLPALSRTDELEQICCVHPDDGIEVSLRGPNVAGISPADSGHDQATSQQCGLSNAFSFAGLTPLPPALPTRP